MESIHRSESRPWINQRKIRIKQFIDEWVAAGISNELRFTETNLLEEARKELGPACEEFDVISAVVEDCDTEKLTVDLENEFVYVNYDKKQDAFEFAEDTCLETLRLQKEHLMKFKEDRTYRSAVHNSMKYKNNYISHDLNSAKDDRNSSNKDHKISDVCALLTCQFFKPVHSSFVVGENRRSPTFVADQEMLVLSSQSLVDLKDAYCCVSDISTPGDCSKTPNSVDSVTAADIYKSGFFFVNNTFYNDMRNNSNVDYSRVIIDWSQDSGRGIGPFESETMENTKFEDLEIQLGYPYLYVHQGNCEHLFVITDIRLHVPQSDSRSIKDYPKIVSTNRRVPIKCLSCNLNTAKWITYGNNRLCEDPYFF
ncbi:snRNA-activating protein complex subunit 3-like isoform X1, partial [Leptotrombidium deliense]